ncbi:alpha/beta fold hydrolase [Actinoplanes sp. URMC 104]|uniref:alpha/beta fold hydrolase n=1 Tax=Actinoplanes sp. URMC 104 TaxID=3423409 RepID=UPI003F1B7F41
MVTRVRHAQHDGLRIAYGIRRPRLRRLPWMVLVQGLGFDRAGWDPVADGLAGHFALVLVDNRGSGESDAPTGQLTVADMAGDVLAVLDDAGVDRAHLVGISLGGMIAQEVAIRHGARVRTLVLAGTTPGWPFAFPMPAATLGMLAAARRLPAEQANRQAVQNTLGADTVRDHPEVLERLIAVHRGGPGTVGWQAQLAAGARFGSLRQGAITAPTLVLHGTADRVVDPRNARLLAERIPGARLELLPGRGHLFFWEDPAAFVATVTAFALEGPP